MLIKTGRAYRRRRGTSIPEAVVALAVTLLVGAAFSSFLYSSSTSLGSLFSYASMDAANQHAVNNMTREIRLARRVIASSPGNLTIENTNGVQVTFAYRTSERSLVRIASGSTTRLLEDCDVATFTLGGASTSNAFGVFPAVTNVSQAKIVNFSWRCSRESNHGIEASDSLTSAKIILRNHGK